ncbi:hypothetical protein [Mucisphaera sp.]|uniref:hypothetical protein n=1 Tax=Mucisphaera sp. TaxID=2913024 RepID=UPI003D097F06
MYVITEGGFVRELFRESVTMLGLVERADFIVVGTGNEGQVYAIDEETLEVSVLADFESEQVSVLEAAGPDGLLVGLSNPARLVSMSEGLTRRGVFVSGVIDAEQISLWGTARLRVDLPAGSSVTFETRSSNLGDPELAGWSSWSNPLGLMSHDSVAPEIPREVTVTSPPARFLQYRITLMSDGAASPEVDAVMVTHVTPNLQPRLLSVSVDVEEVSDPDVTPGAEYGVNWEAEDPNGDRLRYEVSFQRAGSSVWIVAEEELEENRFGWDTARVPDGWYRVRVTADDKLDNPPDMARFARRVSDPVLVDRTPPVIEGLAHRVMPGGRVRVSGVVVDELSAILSIGYAIDGEVSFRPIIPEDLILDSTREAFSITLQGLTQPEHVVTLRVVDRRGQSRLIPLVVDTTDF